MEGTMGIVLPTLGFFIRFEVEVIIPHSSPPWVDKGTDVQILEFVRLEVHKCLLCFYVSIFRYIQAGERFDRGLTEFREQNIFESIPTSSQNKKICSNMQSPLYLLSHISHPAPCQICPITKNVF